MQKLRFIWSRLRHVWQEDPWLRFPGAIRRRLGRQLDYRLRVATVGRLRVYVYHLGRRLGLRVPQRPAQPAAFFWALPAAEAIAARLRAEHPGYVQAVVAWADDVRAHRIELLGQSLQFGPCLEWSSDPASGKTWPRRYYLDLLPVANLTDDTDVKVPYELCRFHQGVVLGLAYRLTGEVAHAAEYVAQFLDWWQQNPYGYGVNWTCTMDVGIRAANLLWAHHLCAGAPALDAAYAATFRRCLYEHGRYIYENPENHAEFNSNHFLANLAGLYYVGVLCPDLPEAAAWADWAQAELEREILKQVYPDGMNFEASTSYHRLSAEFFLYPALLGQRNGRSFSPAYLQRLRGMLEFTRGLLKPDGRVPQIGDNDSGRLHCLAPRHPLDHAYLADLGCLLFSDPAFKRGPAPDPEAVWAFGPEAWARWAAVGPAVTAPANRAFRDGGVYVLRQGGHMLCVACGPNGQAGNGGHAHNDKLSFELNWVGEDVIIDPGTYVYTRYPQWRNRFRSTAWHNTVMLAGQEQNRFRPEGLFVLVHDAEAVCTAWAPDAGRFAGYHTGYDRLGWRHHREISLTEEGNCCCRDWLEPRPSSSQVPPEPVGHLHLAPGLAAALAGPQSVTLTRAGVPIGAVRFAGDVEVSLEDAWYSPGYGIKEPCRAINFRWRAPELTWEISRTQE